MREYKHAVKHEHMTDVRLFTQTTVNFYKLSYCFFTWIAFAAKPNMHNTTSVVMRYLHLRLHFLVTVKHLLINSDTVTLRFLMLAHPVIPLIWIDYPQSIYFVKKFLFGLELQLHAALRYLLSSMPHSKRAPDVCNWKNGRNSTMYWLATK